MKPRPQRDERWQGPDGDLYQIIKVATRQDHQKPVRDKDGRTRHVPAGPRTLAHFRVRHIETGAETQVSAASLPAWSRVTKDPLAGFRGAINTRIKSGASTLILPAKLVNPGEIYHFTCGTIRVDSITERLVKGQKATEWLVKFTRLISEREYFLRSTVPAASPDEMVKPPTEADIEHARIHGNYRSRPEAGGDPLPAVPPDWDDPGVAKRVKDRVEARRELEAERLNVQVRAQLGRVLRGLTIEQRIALLARIERECEAALEKEAA